MFNKLKEFFQGGVSSLELDQSGEPTDRELQIATGVLLLEMAGADADYAPEETKAIFKTLEENFGIEKSEALEVLQLADQARQEKGKIDDFVRAVNDNFNEKQRQRVMAMIWKVIIADYKIEGDEARFANQMKFRLKLSDEQSEEAKKWAQTGKV